MFTLMNQSYSCMLLNHIYSRPISPDSVWKGQGSSTSATAVQGLRPTSTGDGGGGHQKAFGFPGKEISSTVKQLTFPSQSELRPLPFPRLLWVFSCPAPRGIVGICKAGKISREGSRREFVRLRDRPRTTIPSRLRGRGGRGGKRAGEPCARCKNGTLLECAGLAAGGWNRTLGAVARQSGNLGGGQLCN